MSENDTREYWESRLQQQLNLAAIGYRGLGLRYNRWLYNVRRDVFIRVVNRLNIDFDDFSVLDIGSGTGFYIDLWRELGVREIVGSDLTQTVTDRLRQRYPQCNIFQIDIGDRVDSLEGRRFDCVSAFDILFHILDDQQYKNALRNIHSVLKPDGIFIFSENFLHSRRSVAKHQVSRSLETIVAYLNEYGFSVYSRHPMFYLMNAPADSKSLILRLWWLGLRSVVGQNELFGGVIGRFLYPLERGLVLHTREGPSTEMMICRKRN